MRGISVANAGDVFSEDVADTAVGLFIDVLRKITSADRYVRGGSWAVNGDYPLGSKVFSRSLKPSLIRVTNASCAMTEGRLLFFQLIVVILNVYDQAV